MSTSQKFGGYWTKDKLNIFKEYKDAYLKALKKQKFKKVYIDAFAGTGVIETSDGEQYFAGSARIALEGENKFDYYYFIEKDEKKVQELQDMIDTNFPDLKSITKVYCGDANKELEKIIKEIDWRYNRGLLFLDPYATQVEWKTLEKVAKTKAIDVWYLFPFSALNRMLPNDGEYEICANRIDKLLGDSEWRTIFYKEDPQISLFDEDVNNPKERKIKYINTESMKQYIINRLHTIFPCVSKNPRIFKNSKNSPMFLFCFAISNKNERAQNLALGIADYILKNKWV